MLYHVTCRKACNKKKGDGTRYDGVRDPKHWPKHGRRKLHAMSKSGHLGMSNMVKKKGLKVTRYLRFSATGRFSSPQYDQSLLNVIKHDWI